MTKREGAASREIVEISDYLLALYACTRNPAIRPCLPSSSIFNDRDCPKRRPLKLRCTGSYGFPAFSIIARNNDIYRCNPLLQSFIHVFDRDVKVPQIPTSNSIAEQFLVSFLSFFFFSLFLPRQDSHLT